jgi:HD domain
VLLVARIRSGSGAVRRRTHPAHVTYLGSTFLAGPGTELSAEVAQSHHERWDGGGYPDGLRGEEIPEAARMTSVADVLDAITTDRSYQRHRSLAFAIAVISSQSGKQFSRRLSRLLSRYMSAEHSMRSSRWNHYKMKTRPEAPSGILNRRGISALSSAKARGGHDVLHEKAEPCQGQCGGPLWLFRTQGFQARRQADSVAGPRVRQLARP